MPESSPTAPVRPTRRLNLGCGSRFHREWTNVDMVAGGEGVVAHDLIKGLPFEASTFDVVYHSHVLEHFPAEMALAFLRECHRVLRGGGVIRVAVPDLERIARIYLESLDAAISDHALAHDRYQWMVLEMYDQAIRETPGGAMARCLRNPPNGIRDFVVQRLGVEASRLLGPPDDSEDTVQAREALVNPPREPTSQALPRQSRFRRLAALVRHPYRIREMMIRRLLGSEYELLQLGRFRRGGEIHQWMYDRHSLGRLLTDAGFANTAVRGPAESQIVGWCGFNLDTEPDGSTYKPDSLFMEAVKP